MKHALCVNHLLFANNRDVEGEGAHPFQHLRIPSALVPGWQKDKLICRVWDAVFCGLKDPLHLHPCPARGSVQAGAELKRPSVGWSCSHFALFTLAAHDIFPTFLTEDSIFFPARGMISLAKGRESSGSAPWRSVPAPGVRGSRGWGRCVRGTQRTRAFAFQIG